MTDITININTGSENNEPKVTTNTDKSKSDIPKGETSKDDKKDETPLENDSAKEETSAKDDSKKMDMTEEEHAKMSADKSNPSVEDIPKKEDTHPKKTVHKKG